MRSAGVRCYGGVTSCLVMWSSPPGSSPCLLCRLLRCPEFASVPTEGCSDETPGPSSRPRPGPAQPLWQPVGPGPRSAAGWTVQQSPELPGRAGPGSWLHPAASSRSHAPPAAERSVLSRSPAILTQTPPGAFESEKATLKNKRRKICETVETASQQNNKSLEMTSHSPPSSPLS